MGAGKTSLPSCASSPEPLLIKPNDLLRWDKTHGSRFVHDFFKFPGKFHPPIVENILNRLKPHGVIDPMAGVGTVAVEAKAAGIPSLSIDVDPLSIFFTRVKTTPISRSTLESAWRSLRPVLDQIRRSEEQIGRFQFEDIAPSTMLKYLGKTNARHLALLDYWFRRYVLVDYARIDHSIWNGGLPHSANAVRRFFYACLLSSVRRISNADPYPVSGVEITKHMREKIDAGYKIDVAGEFERRVILNIDRMEGYVSYLRESGTLKTQVEIVQDDCLNISKIQKQLFCGANLIVFSPPYCNAIEYWRRHRLEYLLGGFMTAEDLGTHQKKFIGRLAVGSWSTVVPASLGSEECDETIHSLYVDGQRRKAWQLWHYFHDMKVRLGKFLDALPPRGHAIIIVGDSRTYGKIVPTAQILQGMAVEVGFELEEVVRYPIKNRTMQYPLKNGDSKIMEESIIVLSKLK